MKARYVIFLVLFASLFYSGWFFYQNLRGSRPAFAPVTKITPIPKESTNTTGLPLTLPPGFSISVYAKNIPNARVLAWDPEGKLLVSSPQTGKVFRVSEDGSVSVVIEGLNLPHGLAFKDGKLYIAETNQVAAYDYAGTATNKKKLFDLPGGGNHFSRTIGFGPDGKLYVSIGSSCNVCVEKDKRRASIMVYDGELKPFAKGLRNSVFFTWRNGEMWATDMGRDLLGDNTPSEEVNIIKQGKDYGWPYCYSKQISDTSFGGTTERCQNTEPPVIEYQAHSAPLGLAFDNEYLYVAYHGSWNRSEPTGYKIVRFDVKNNYASSDFITGWLQGDSALGRPVDVLFDPQGNLYVSDDKAGVVYKITRT